MALGTRIVFFFLIILVATTACSNEPFQDPDVLTVSNLTGTNPKAKTKITRSFTYKSQKLLAASYSETGFVSASHKFYYDGDRVKLIVSDSSKMTRKETSFSYFDNKTIDITYQIDRIAKLDTPTQVRDTVIVSTLYSERTINYADEHPVMIQMKTRGADGLYTETRTDLTWENGNVVRQVVSNLTTSTLIQDVTIAYNDKAPIFAPGLDYELILGPKEFFWLSANNPVSFTENGTTVGYSYNYNKFGYPNDITGDNGVTFGFAYARLK